jgi:predicted ester cyclase
MPSKAIRKKREKLVLDHFHDEVVQQWDDVLSTFPHPRYEIIPLMAVHDGDSAVRAYYHNSRVAFPDQNHEIISFRHADDAIITEFWLTGTHDGPLGEIPPSGSKFRVRMTAFFIFDENENLICERIYFDTLTMLKQLFGVLNFKNPMNWWRVVQAIRGLLKNAGQGGSSPELTKTTPVEFPDYQHLPISQRK